MMSNKVENNEKNAGIPNIIDVWSARERNSQIVRKTPLIHSFKVSEQIGSNVFLKMENLHEIGAFKIRGAANKILSLTVEQQKRGVATYSTGNHGIAVSYVARQLNIPACVFISERVPEAKVNVLRRLGAVVEINGSSQDEAGKHCYKEAEEKGYTVVEPFDDPHVIAGQGTIGLEILEDVSDIDTVIIPLSGGGLLSGVAMALKSKNPSIRVVGVSMEKGAVMYHSLKAGKPVVMEEGDTLADSLLGGIGVNNQYTFSMVQKYMDEVILIPEENIARAMAYILENHRMIVEGAAAIGVGALLGEKIKNPGKKVAAVVTGNNVNLSSFMEATKKYWCKE
ncbi:hydroxyectoine utilization dehydratase EutB [Geosporobacter ferrireducens]|nr:hydroxyectoine utilization dehydratase EutB [Geosporobacter ferrireducens]